MILQTVMNLNKKILFVIVLVVSITMAVATAQQVSTTVQGYVSDKNGVLINGAAINVTRIDTATGSSTSQETKTDTNELTGLNGYYSFRFESGLGRNYSYVTNARYNTISNTAIIPSDSAADLVINITLLPKPHDDIDGYSGTTVLEILHVIVEAPLNSKGFEQVIATLDTNSDGSLAIADAIDISKATLNNIGLEQIIAPIDIDNDGSLTISDLLRLGRFNEM